MCGIFLHVVRPGKSLDIIDGAKLFSLIDRRGPTIQKKMEVTFPFFKALFYSSVLHLRGLKCVAQPIYENSYIFQWNGEIFGSYPHVEESENDTAKLFDLLCQNSDTESVFLHIKGPWAFTFYDGKRNILYFGRDIFGRRSLFMKKEADSLTLSSIPFDLSYVVIDCGKVYSLNCFDFSLKSTTIYNPIKISSMTIISDNETDLCNTLSNLLKSSIYKMINCYKGKHLSILFSGGLDCSIITFFVLQMLASENKSIELVNVQFQSDQRSDSHDKILGFSSYLCFKKLFPEADLNFKGVNVCIKEYKNVKNHILKLIGYNANIMDLSIASPFWFGSRAAKSNVIFLGSGADELFGGYHKYKRGTFKEDEIVRQLSDEVFNIGYKNLTRDDCVIADNGKESRHPFLDEDVVSFSVKLPLKFKLQRTDESYTDKYILRLLAKNIGLDESIYCASKKAIQFGSRSSKMEGTKLSGYQKINL